MKYPSLLLRVGCSLVAIITVLLCQPQLGRAEPTLGLAFREVKITDTEFVVLQNEGTSPVQLSDYWLGYASNDQAGNIVPTQQLPAGILIPGGAIVLTNDATDTCDATVVSGLGFSSLSDTKGALAIRYLQNNGTTSTFTTVDAVTWSKPSASGTTTDNIDLRKESGITTPVWYKSPGGDVWQVGAYDSCSLAITVAGSGTTPSTTHTVNWPQTTTNVPATIVSLAGTASDGATGKFLPAADKGLKAPQMSEIFPNPAAPQMDATDEFIELYNPNNAKFDLTGFTLQTGSTTSATRHNYVFPSNTWLPAHDFKAFYSKQTGLAINNTGGQVWLLDPFGTAVTKTDPYLKPKEGTAWATAQGKWYYTTTPTPGLPNRISEPVSAAAKTAQSIAKTTQGTPVSAIAASSGVASAGKAGYHAETEKPSSPIHPFTLAIVIGLALLYGAYEYRHDVANRIHQFRANRETGS
jgi:hypothetical protein